MAVERDTDLIAQTLQDFDDLQREVFSYQYAQQVINYDGETVGPIKGVDARGEALAVLAEQEHRAAYGDRAGAIISTLAPVASELDGLHQDELRVFSRLSSRPARRSQNQILNDF